jgi:hypothetical protein
MFATRSFTLLEFTRYTGTSPRAIANLSFCRCRGTCGASPARWRSGALHQVEAQVGFPSPRALQPTPELIGVRGDADLRAVLRSLVFFGALPVDAAPPESQATILTAIGGRSRPPADRCAQHLVDQAIPILGIGGGVDQLALAVLVDALRLADLPHIDVPDVCRGAGMLPLGFAGGAVGVADERRTTAGLNVDGRDEEADARRHLTPFEYGCARSRSSSAADRPRLPSACTAAPGRRSPSPSGLPRCRCARSRPARSDTSAPARARWRRLPRRP